MLIWLINLQIGYEIIIVYGFFVSMNILDVMIEVLRRCD